MSIRFTSFVFSLSLLWCFDAFGGRSLPLRQKVLDEADRILNLANVSYVYGGRKLGAAAACDQCTSCLGEKKPSKENRLLSCPVCRECSLDCSNFVRLVFNRAGMKTPYLTTLQMREIGRKRLLKQYGWVDLGSKASRALPGDLLVYPGHVVIVERLLKPGVGDVVHATSGSEVRGPGHGIQRQTLIHFDRYKGPLQKVLRHKDLLSELRKKVRPQLGRR